MEFSTQTEEIKLKIRKIIYNFENITTKMKSFPRTDLSTSLCEARPSSLVSLSRIWKRKNSTKSNEKEEGRGGWVRVNLSYTSNKYPVNWDLLNS